VLDSAMVTAGARQYVATIDPTLASELPTLPSIPIRLPTAEVPIVSHVRATTDAWVPRLFAIAIVCFLGALVFGNRVRIVRYAGIWAILAGLFWMATPTWVSWASDAWVPGHQAVVHALFRGVGGSVHAAAIDLIVMGVLATTATIVLSNLRRTRLALPRLKPRRTPAVRNDHQYPNAARRFGFRGWARSEADAPEEVSARR